ncbi:hypothetical protein [Salinactinospora qingdaonensis]|uniref:Tetratricopeptide repeat protein n=1 Tax=Salinactinospora qingdaonensis TaxID=702744 RepID=A0ABP7FF68_9ACTN
MTNLEDRLAAIGTTAASAFRAADYRSVRAEDIAAQVQVSEDSADKPRRTGRSAVWLYNTVKSRRVLVALAAYSAWCGVHHFEGEAAGEATRALWTLGQAREAVTRILTEIVVFQQRERHLMTQVGSGLGDIATSEKRQRGGSGKGSDEGDASETAPTWPDGPWGRVAAQAWQGSLGVFADALTPVLSAATGAVTEPREPTVTAGARVLSDLAFRGFLTAPDSAPERVARGLTAFWFEHELVATAGEWVRELDSAEQALAATTKRGTDPRAEAAGRAVLIRVLLEAGTLHRRGVTEGRRLLATLDELVTENPAPGVESPWDRRRVDQEARGDAAGRLGLSLLRWGDLRAAEEAYLTSRAVAERDLDGSPSRLARADTNLCDVWAQTGETAKARTGIERAVEMRRDLLANATDPEAAWRRLSLTEAARVRVAIHSGQPTTAVDLAERLLADRRSRIAAEGGPNMAEARLLLAEALLTAGQPAAARFQVEQAERMAGGPDAPAGYRAQSTVVLRARIAMAAGEHTTALDLLEHSSVTSDWFAEQVSFRLGFTARRLRGGCLVELGEAATAHDRFEADIAHLRQGHGLADTDPLLLAYLHDTATALLATASPERARQAAGAAWSAAADREDPWRAATLVVAARCADALGERADALEMLHSAHGVTEFGVAAFHPVLLEARYHEARLCEDRARVAALLAPLLDRKPLAHGYPALGEGHRLLRDAQVLADERGLSRRADDDVAWQDL